MTPVVPHQALYRRWRAQTFGEIVGQEAVVETLRNAVRSGQVAHALLFVGPRGTGKTSLARIVAKALNCTDLHDGEPCDRCEACAAIREGRALDVIEMDAASNNRVDDMRDLLARTMTAPSDLRRKVYIVDEVQRITQGWDVLLRTLEEPPEHVAFIFCTTDASQIRPAVLSRVQRFDFRRLTVPQIEGKLRRILDADGRSAEPQAITLVARLAAGGMRDAESMLDQLLSSGADVLSSDQVRELLGLAEIETVGRFIDALVGGDALAGIAVLEDLEDRGRDLRAFLDQVVDDIRARLVDVLAGRTPESAAGAVGPGPAPARLAAAGRRLAEIDPSRAGPGGLRFQLELALLAAPDPVTGALEARRPAADARPTPARAAASMPPKSTVAHEPEPEPEPAPAAAPEPAIAPAAAHEPEPQPEPETKTASAPESEPATAHAPEAAPAAAPASPRRTRASASAAAVHELPAPREGVPQPADRGSGPARRNRPTSADEGAPVGGAEAAAAPTPAAPPDAGAPGPLDELRRQWPEIVRAISQHPPTKPLITACRPISVDGSVVTLGFPEEQAFLKDVAERRRAILEEGVGRCLGRAVQVRCVATNLDLVAPLPVDEAEGRLLAEARRIFGDDLLDVGEVG